MQKRFRLQAVLNYRADVEESLQLELGRLQAEELAARAQLDALRTEAARTMADTQELQDQTRPDIGAIAQGFVYLEAVQSAIAAQLQIVASVAARVEAKRAEVIAAMQARKIIEKLKQKHELAYGEWVRHTDERAIDDIATIRYARRLANREGMAE